MQTWPAVVSLIVGAAGFLLGTWDYLAHSGSVDPYSAGFQDPFAYRLMIRGVLPCGIGAILIGALALASLAQDEPGPSSAIGRRARRIARLGVGLGAVVAVLALLGALSLYVKMAGPD